jgi:hypothetical protein
MKRPCVIAALPLALGYFYLNHQADVSGRCPEPLGPALRRKLRKAVAAGGGGGIDGIRGAGRALKRASWGTLTMSRVITSKVRVAPGRNYRSRVLPRLVAGFEARSRGGKPTMPSSAKPLDNCRGR